MWKKILIILLLSSCSKSHIGTATSDSNTNGGNNTNTGAAETCVQNVSLATADNVSLLIDQYNHVYDYFNLVNGGALAGVTDQLSQSALAKAKLKGIATIFSPAFITWMGDQNTNVMVSTDMLNFFANARFAAEVVAIACQVTGSEYDETVNTFASDITYAKNHITDITSNYIFPGVICMAVRSDARFDDLCTVETDFRICAAIK